MQGNVLLLGFLLAFLSFLSVAAAELEADTIPGDFEMGTTAADLEADLTPDDFGGYTIAADFEADTAASKFEAGTAIDNFEADTTDDIQVVTAPVSSDSTCPVVLDRFNIKEVFDEFCKVRSDPDHNLSEDFVIAKFDASNATDVEFLRDEMGITFQLYPHLVFFPRGINHTSQSCNLTMDVFPSYEAARTAEKLFEEFKVEAYTEIVQKISGGQCGVVFSHYEAWANRTCNGEADVERVPALKLLMPDGTSETYDGNCDDVSALEAWIQARLLKSNVQMDEIRLQFTQATTEAEKKALFIQGVQKALEMSTVVGDVEDYFSFFRQAVESLDAMPVEHPKEEL
ncbi:hypothetical protein BGZ67_002125 [Mortierella alpina]|nr:hypothetical protein BGZ67_002125 [Mortierella alpina]